VLRKKKAAKDSSKVRKNALFSREGTGSVKGGDRRRVFSKNHTLLTEETERRKTRP